VQVARQDDVDVEEYADATWLLTIDSSSSDSASEIASVRPGDTAAQCAENNSSMRLTVKM
jgi:hypothetical protein